MVEAKVPAPQHCSRGTQILYEDVPMMEFCQLTMLLHLLVPTSISDVIIFMFYYLRGGTGSASAKKGGSFDRTGTCQL